MMRRWVTAVLRWLLARAAPPPGRPAPSEIQAKAAVLVQTYHEQHPDTGGEWKRSQVYAKMIKAFPHVQRRVLGLAIEEAVMALKGVE